MTLECRVNEIIDDRREKINKELNVICERIVEIFEESNILINVQIAYNVKSGELCIYTSEGKHSMAESHYPIIYEVYKNNFSQFFSEIICLLRAINISCTIICANKNEIKADVNFNNAVLNYGITSEV